MCVFLVAYCRVSLEDPLHFKQVRRLGYRRNNCFGEQSLRCSVLQCTAVRCSSLQCAAVRCSALQCAAVCCSVLQYIAAYCSVWQCVAVCGSVWQCTAKSCSALQCVAVCWCLQLINISITTSRGRLSCHIPRFHRQPPPLQFHRHAPCRLPVPRLDRLRVNRRNFVIR